MPTVEVLRAFARWRPPTQKKVAGLTYADVKEALKADPDAAIVLFRELLRDRGYNVRYWVCYLGAEVCGHKFVPDLQAAFNDRSQTVQEAAMWSLLEMDTSGRLLQPLLPGMRKSVVKWNYDGAFGPVRLLALMNDKEAVPYIERFLERPDIEKWDRVRGQEYLQHLNEGIEPTLARIRDHADHAQMARWCHLAFDVGAPGVETALEHLLATAPDDRCRMIASQTLDALKMARSKGPGPYLLKGGLKYHDLPKVEATS